MTCWGPDKLGSPMGKKPIGTLKRTDCQRRRFWVCLPPTHHDIVLHEGAQDIIGQGWKWEATRLGKCMHWMQSGTYLVPLHSRSHFTWRFWARSWSEPTMWIIPGLAGFTSPFPLLPHTLCPLQSIFPTPPPVIPASTSACPLHPSPFTGFLLQASYTLLPAECFSLPVPIDDSKYILPIFYLVTLSLGLLLRFILSSSRHIPSENLSCKNCWPSTNPASECM